MKKTDILVNLLASDIENKKVLEVACGTADFSVSAAKLAKSVFCIDLDDSRLSDQAKNNNICFQIMDAAKMFYSDKEFDTIVIYNAFFHIQTQWKMIESECKRVIKSPGAIYIVGTWSLDTNLMIDVFGDRAVWKDGFLIVKVTNKSD
ncbi:MAG: class I SAM-dependent methyltransferase [Lachnospiraceae bacterium]|nr:class I SAM-dependent methyltransferase [Lachnospiraceae bacterium]